jgi:hypothetical protein
LERNQSSDSRSVHCINQGQVKNDIPAFLVYSRAQNGSLITAHNSAKAVQGCDFAAVFDSYSQHAQSSRNSEPSKALPSVGEHKANINLKLRAQRIQVQDQPTESGPPSETHRPSTPVDESAREILQGRKEFLHLGSLRHHLRQNRTIRAKVSCKLHH